MQGTDGKAAGKDAPAAAKDKDSQDKVARVRLNPDLAALGKGASKEAEAWHEKSAVKRLEAVRLRGALLDAGSPPLPRRPPPCLLSWEGWQTGAASFALLPRVVSRLVNTPCGVCRTRPASRASAAARARSRSRHQTAAVALLTPASGSNDELAASR